MQGLLGVQQEGEGRPDGEEECESIVLAGQGLAESHALGGQRRVHSSSHFLLLSELRKCERKGEGYVFSLAASEQPDQHGLHGHQSLHGHHGLWENHGHQHPHLPESHQ